MATFVYGLPPEAVDFINEKRARPGDPCWCCGLPLPEADLVVSVIKLQDGTTHKLLKYVLKEPGMMAEEFVQVRIEKEDNVHYWLGLKVKPDGSLSTGNGREILWEDANYLNVLAGE